MDRYTQLLNDATPTGLVGSIVETTGATAAVADFPAPVGAVVEIERRDGNHLTAEVIGFRGASTIIFPHRPLAGIRRGSRVRLLQTVRQLRVGPSLLGRIVNAHGRCIDGRPHPMLSERTRLDRQPPSPVDRPRITQPFETGIRVLDGCLRCGQGQRLGIFAGAGVGKSVLLGMLSRYTQADVNIIALIGERGRELNDFIERDLGPEGLARSILVVATSDEPAVLRIQAAYTATTLAEYFRDQGKNVLLLVDSVTRFAMALRETGLASGEPPATRGYPPSMFATLPQLVERAGRNHLGSITAFYSVLVEGDDPDEPVADTLRGLLDGHLWLSRRLASAGHYPAIDLLESLSRLMPDITPPAEQQAAQTLRRLLAAYREHEDLISVGAYRKGTNREVDVAIELQQALNLFLRQETREKSSLAETTKHLLQIANVCYPRLQPPSAALAQPAEAPAVAATSEALANT